VRLAFPILLIVALALLYLRALERGWIAAVVEVGVGLILLPLVIRSGSSLWFAINSLCSALIAWVVALFVYLAFNPLD
jgi:hypothetical protein